jgi:hypothetical protein
LDGYRGVVRCRRFLFEPVSSIDGETEHTANGYRYLFKKNPRK